SMIQVSRMTPTPAVIVLALLSICYLPVTNIDLLIITIGSATWLSIGLAVFCIPYLRLTQPNKYRFNCLAIICSIIFILATLILTVLALIANPWQTGPGLIIILNGVPAYGILYWINTKCDCAIPKITKFLQKILVVVTPTQPENA
ncbi:hypothetical protein QYM36_006227, partial [Artemia franciscana]